MKTTVHIDEDLMRELRARCRRSDTTFRAELNTLLRRGLHEPAGPPRRKPCRIPVFNLGAARCGEPALVKALALADALEGEEILRKLEARK